MIPPRQSGAGARPSTGVDDAFEGLSDDEFWTEAFALADEAQRASPASRDGGRRAGSPPAPQVGASEGQGVKRAREAERSPSSGQPGAKRLRRGSRQRDSEPAPAHAPSLQQRSASGHELVEPVPSTAASDLFGGESDEAFWAAAFDAAERLHPAPPPAAEKPVGSSPVRRLTAVQDQGGAKDAHADGSAPAAVPPSAKPLRHVAGRDRAAPAPVRASSPDDDSQSELELVIPTALGADRPRSLRAPTSWWQRLDDATRHRVEQRLGPDFDFETDDPARAWQTIPSPGYWVPPDVLIQWDEHTLVSKSRFAALTRERFKETPVSDEDIRELAQVRNVLIRTKKTYSTVLIAKEHEPDLFEAQTRQAGLHGPSLQSDNHRLAWPGVLAQADAETFVSGEKLKRKLDSAGVKLGQLLREDQVFIRNHNERGNATGVFSDLGVYIRGYRALTPAQTSQLGLPPMVQAARDPSTKLYRDFTDALYPRDGEPPYPKASTAFAQAAATGFRNLKGPQDGWADEAAAMDMSNPRAMAARRTGGGGRV